MKEEKKMYKEENQKLSPYKMFFLVSSCEMKAGIAFLLIRI